MCFLFVIVGLLSNLVFAKVNDDKKKEINLKEIEINDEVFVVFDNGVISIFF